MKKYYVLLLSTIVGLQVCAQNIEIKTSDEPIKITPTGRIYFDGAGYIEDESSMSNGTAISDIRIGLKAVYKKWDVKIDMGYGSNKVSTKDIHLRYNFDSKSYLQLAYRGEFYGNEGWESTASVKFSGKAPVTQAFETGRRLGIIYSRWDKHYWLGGGVYGDGEVITNSTKGDDGYAFTGRLTYMPVNTDGKLLQVGLSGTYRRADANGVDADGKDVPRQVSYGATVGTTAVDKTKALSVLIPNAKYQGKYNIEFLGNYGPLFLQAEYYQANVGREETFTDYKGSGAFAQLGFLALGKSYSYNAVDARLKKPGAGSLEFVLRYDYLDLDDHKSGLYGGRMSDWAFGVNYYINKYVLFMANYSNVKLNHRAAYAPGETINAIQGRVMVVF